LGPTPKKDTQEELEDTKGVIWGRKPKKDKQEEFEYIKGVTRPYIEEGQIKKTLLVCPSSVYGS
jgi:hypothetical protein